MATKFLEPGGDADFLVGITNGFWVASANGTIVTDFVHGSHIKSIKYDPGTNQQVSTPTGIISDSGTRISFYLYLVTLPNAVCTIAADTSATAIRLRMTSTGVLQMWNGTVQIGTDGSALLTDVWYRISIAYTIASTSVNQIRVFKDSVLDISITNATLTTITQTQFRFGNISTNTTLDFRTSDHYIDDSSSLLDTGNIWVTAKRPNANGTANNFSTQVGAGGSGYGSGHSPQVNERPLSTTSGWSVVAVGATTEEYNIEGKAIGDINIASYNIVDYMGWVSAKALLSETASIRVNNVDTNISLTSTITLFTKIAGSTTYPSGSGHDIGIITDATATTVTLYECGLVVAYIPNTNPLSIAMRKV